MSDEPDDGMAAILAANPIEKPAEEAAPEAKAEEKPPLELTDDDEAVEVDEGGDEEPGDEHKPRPRRSKPASERIAELTARLRDAERKLEAKDAPAEVKAPEKPNPEDFEFGEADPGYIDKLTDWKIETRDQEKTKAAEATREVTELTDKLNAGVAKAETDAKAKYADFDERIAEAVEARAGEPLPPLLTIGIGVSPVGGDIIYQLATDDATSAKLEKLAAGNPNAFAMAFGELEGAHLADNDDADLDMADPLDMARMLGRMRARLRGDAKPAGGKAAVSVTSAPEPPADRARGGSGKFEVGADTSDFAAFERKVNGKR